MSAQDPRPSAAPLGRSVSRTAVPWAIGAELASSTTNRRPAGPSISYSTWSPSYRTEAAIFLSGMPANALAETCLKNGMRLVLINRDEERAGALRLRLNDAEAGRHAVAVLMAAGCRRLALASSSGDTPSLTGRERGFVAAAETDFEWVHLRGGPTSYATGQELGMDLLTRTRRPDGIFCTTDLMACGISNVARWRLGLRIPDHLSLIGFDDIAQAGWDGYALTTFRQPIEDIAAESVAWLTTGGRSDATNELLLQPRLIMRGSVSRPACPGLVGMTT